MGLPNTNTRRSKFGFAAIIFSLAGLAFAEESSILDNATISTNGNVRAWSTAKPPLIDGNFKTLQYQDAPNTGDVELSIILDSPKKIVSAFVQNRVDGGLEVELGSSAIYIGDDTAYLSPSLAKCSDDFYDTSFLQFASPCTGQVISIRRTGLPSNGSTDYAIG